MQHDKDAFTIIEFCQRHGLSRSAFYLASQTGKGPDLMHVGHRVMISREAAARWREKCEAEHNEATKAALSERAKRISALSAKARAKARETADTADEKPAAQPDAAA
jgi:hypothetical protein